MEFVFSPYQLILSLILALSGTIPTENEQQRLYLNAHQDVVVRNRMDLKGDTLFLPKSAKLVFKSHGQIINGHIIFNNTTIVAKEKAVIFKNISAEGKINNSVIIVRWFGCRPNSSPEENFRTLKYGIIPVAVESGADIYHSENGVYKIKNQYPVYESSWRTDHSYIRDFNGITIYGRGYKTIIKATKYDNNKNPSDVFNLVDLKNISIRNLGITSESTKNNTAPHGTNGISLIETIENVTISNCYIFDLPSVYNSSEVTVDGGHGITIQSGDSNTIQRNIHIFNNTIDNVSLGLDFTKGVLGKKGIVDNIVFEGNTVTNSYIGFYSHGKHENVSKTAVIFNNTFKNCQYGIYGYAMQGFTFRGNTIITTERIIRDTKIKNGVYGVLIYGPKDILFKDNKFKLKNADSFITIDVVSKNPIYNGFIENVIISNNEYRGTSRNGFFIQSDSALIQKMYILDSFLNNNSQPYDQQ